MKTVILFILLSLSLAFIPERSFLASVVGGQKALENNQENVLEVTEEKTPVLQRQNALLVFPDLEDLETSDSDTFQVDQTYFYGLNSSFSDLFNEINKESADKEEINVEELLLSLSKFLNESIKEVGLDKNSIKDAFEIVENTAEGIFDEALAVVSQLSKEASENKTLFGMDKSAIKEFFGFAKENFDEIFDQTLLALSQVSDQSSFDLDKESVKEYFDDLEENFDEIFDGVLSTLNELSQESNEKKTLFGVDKSTIKEVFGVAEENFEKMISEVTSQLTELLNNNNTAKVLSEYFNEADASAEPVEIKQEDLDEILLAVRQLFNETVEEKALFGTEQNSGVNSDETDSLELDNTYFNGLGFNLTISTDDSNNETTGTLEVDLDKILLALGGIINDAIENGALLDSEQSDK